MFDSIFFEIQFIFFFVTKVNLDIVLGMLPSIILPSGLRISNLFVIRVTDCHIA